MAQTEQELVAQHAGKAHYYNPAKNPDNAYIAGVPMRDLGADEWDSLSAQQQRDALHHGYWRLTPVPREQAEDAPPEAPAPKAKRPAPAPRTSAPVVNTETGQTTIAVEWDTAGSNAVPSPVVDAAPPNPVGAEEAGS